MAFEYNTEGGGGGALERFCNKVSTVPESPWPKVSVEQKFEI